MRGGRILSLALALALVAGCGGGDGQPAAVITAENAAELSGIAVEMIGFSSELAFLLQDFWFLIEEEFPSGSYPCAGGGSFTATIQDVDPVGVLSAGDRVVLEFFDCEPDEFDPDFVVNGAFTFFVNSATNSFPADETVVTYTLDDLRIRTGSLAFAYRGGLQATETTADHDIWTDTIEIDSLRWILDVDGVGTFDQEIRNAVLTEESNDLTDDWRAWIEGDFYDSGVGGVMRLVTVEEFQGSEDGNPESGILEIWGADDSRCRIIAMGGENVRLEVDENGDGLIDSVEDTTWDAISP